MKIELAEALKEQQSNTKGPRIIPAIISKCRIPKTIKSIFWVNFSKSWADGLSGLLSGIFRDRQVIKLVIRKNHPLELETKDFQRWIEEFLYRKIPMVFVLDDHDLIDEISHLAKTDNIDGEVSTLLRFSSLSMLNFCLYRSVIVLLTSST